MSTSVNVSIHVSEWEEPIGMGETSFVTGF